MLNWFALAGIFIPPKGGTTNNSTRNLWCGYQVAELFQLQFGMNSKSWFTILSLTLACFSLPVISGCDRATGPAQLKSAKKQPAVNLFGARKLDPAVAKAEVEKAWNNYLASINVEPPDKPVGMTEKEIEFIESEIRQKLPEDLKAFLRVYLANGRRFNDGFEIMNAKEIADWWKFMSELNYLNEHIFVAPDANGDPTWFEPYLIPSMQYDTYEIHFDIRNGKVIEMLDGPCGVMANSLTEMLDEMAAHHRAGRAVEMSTSDGKKVGPFLNSQLWNVYEH